MKKCHYWKLVADDEIIERDLSAGLLTACGYVVALDRHLHDRRQRL